MTTTERPSPSRSTPVKLAHRYAPFVAILALQLGLVAITPEPSARREATLRSNAAPGASEQESLTGTAGSAGTTTPANTTPSVGGSRTEPATSTGDRPTATTTPSQRLADGTAPRVEAANAVDFLGRPVTGDRSKCAPGGLVQEAVTAVAMPCIPRFTGDNGGGTYQGVTKDIITVVLYIPSFGPAVDAALQRAGLYPAPEEWREALQLFLGFINKHYELYGRRLVGHAHFVNCSDAACYRADAKALVAKYRPFAVIGPAEDGSTITETAVDQLTQLGVVVRGAPALSDEWFKNHAPYAWGVSPQGFRLADMMADYYCKKMYGKNATRAGDPTLQVRRRKLGILTTDDPMTLEVWRRYFQQVTGGMCGSESDGTALYTIPADETQAQNQGDALITRLKSDGVTTVAGLVPLGQDADEQQYFPENLTASQEWQDFDSMGRLAAALRSPTQMSNTFGLGWWPAARPYREMDYYRAAKDVNPNAEPPGAVDVAWRGITLIGRLIQWAGPNLTPKNVELGAQKSPQLGGWTNPNPWPGWKCCNPYVEGWKLSSGPNSYTAVVDAREIYWDSKAISRQDNQLGAWVCVNECRRYEVGQWPRGEPLQ